MIQTHTLFATAARGLEPVLRDELEALGAADAREQHGGVSFTGPLELAYRACLWSRTASRILLRLGEFEAADADALHGGVTAIAWEDHLGANDTLAVDFTGTSPAIRNTQFGAQKVKDGVVDRFRRLGRERPSVSRERPDLRINVHLHRERASVAVDLAGEPLHRRGYRQEGVAAPMKETLAAGLLYKCGWPEIAAEGGSFLDPLCGSGTLLVEAAWMAGDVAPGLLRDYWGFSRWRGHDPETWQRLKADAIERRERGTRRIPRIQGLDRDPAAIRAARINADAAGVWPPVRVERRDLGEGAFPRDLHPGLVLTNPPYGERIGGDGGLGGLYAQLGDWLKAHCVGWQAGVLTTDTALGKHMGLRAVKTNRFRNGPLDCTLLQFKVEEAFFVDRQAADARARTRDYERAIAAGAEDFANRLKKNLKNLRRWAKREDTNAWRAYDRDLPEYAVAVDVYGDHAHVQEYAPPAKVDPERARERLEQVLAVAPVALDIPPEHVHLKVRRRQKGSEQYRRVADSGRFLEVREGPARLWVNLDDYLDTGLFLDHRPVRRWIREQAKGGRFLNLFCYTATATVQAALGGARETTSVDMSKTYLDWARRNLELNELNPANHRLVQADVLEWLNAAQGRYDLILLDPPTFSNSKNMAGTLDIQRDHVALIRKATRLLAPGGVLLFSTNARRFRLAEDELSELHFEDITRKSLPEDFKRNPRIHHAWLIRTGHQA